MTSKADYKQIPGSQEPQKQTTPGHFQIEDEESKAVDTARHREGIV